MQGERRSRWFRRLASAAGTGLLVGWIFGLNAVPPRVSVEQGGSSQWIPLSGGMYWLGILGFSVWFSILFTLIVAILTGISFFIRSKNK